MIKNGRKRTLKDLDALLARFRNRKRTLDKRRDSIKSRQSLMQTVEELKRDAGLSTDSTGS